ncbi:MAG: aminotransferase class V-fold PLP-dependent enzyme [Verrucomicrobia bacterium]|nr:aminotransferase class V-fold PLP-dependent enzyme [Verrucomicrobiota bacterium]
MTIAELHSNEELRRHEFPVVEHKNFLAHAGVCPLPRRVVDAMTDYSLLGALGDQEEAFPGTRIQQVRQTAAQLLNAQPDEIAFVGPTSLGLSMVAAGLSFRKGDNILIYHDDYPSNVYPWMALADKGVQVRLMNIRELGRIRNIDVIGQVDENTRLVALASCHFVSGWRIDIAGIGKQLRARNIPFCVDGIQTLGAFPTTVEHVDFLAADAHKWLLGPCAAGILYVRKALQERLKPSVLGWHNVRCANFVAQEQIVHPPDSRRFEAGSANLVGLAGLQAGMDLLLSYGIENIAAELLRKRALLVPELQAKGYAVLGGSAPPENASGIVTFYMPDGDMSALHAKLTEANVITSLRASRAGQRYIRLSPHFYNTDDELRRVLELL